MLVQNAWPKPIPFWGALFEHQPLTTIFLITPFPGMSEGTRMNF